MQDYIDELLEQTEIEYCVESDDDGEIDDFIL